MSDKIITSIHTARTEKRPRCVKFGRWRRYRWYAKTSRLIEGEHKGVYDKQLHLFDDSSWALTKWGAMFASARAADQAPAKAKRRSDYANQTPRAAFLGQDGEA